MSEQLTLFDTEKISFYEKVQDILDEIIFSHDLPTNSLHLYSNKSSRGKNAGCQTSTSICIFEPEYPPRKGVEETPGKNFIIMNIKDAKDNKVELLIRTKQYDSIELPCTANVKSLKSDKSFLHVFFEKKDVSVFEYIEENILYCLANYESSNSFGCCSKFVECSDARKCVHENRIYSMGCKYRMNLEAGKIFYGKNKNI